VSTYIRLRLVSEEYAVPVTQVREVIELGEVTRVPGSPPHAHGIRNLRGQVLPVFGLARLLSVPGESSPGLLMIAESGSDLAGFAIDEVSGVAELPEPNSDAEQGLLRGTVLADGALIGVIDIPTVIGSLAGAAS
jgi:chemotaxis signal transduction protein